MTKYTTIFSSTVRPLVSEEKDKYLAMASLVDVGDFVPDIDTDSNIDILPIAFNACVVNRVNKNGDVIDSSVATEIVENFINKPINIEHNRDRVIGTILSAGFSEFGTDRPLTEEQVKELKGPYNITLGGIVWKIVNSELADMIENSNDPTSEEYQKISASWELGFSGYNLVAMEGMDKNIENGRVISDPEEVEKLSENLKSFGGNGKIDDNVYVYRNVFENVLPLGIGLTETPAADVLGVAIKTKQNQKEEERVVASEHSSEEAENQKKTSLSDDYNVKNTKLVVMKIDSLKDISDESLKTLEASAVHDFIQDELRKASEEFAAKQKESKTALEAAEEQYKTLTTEHEGLKSELDKVSETLSELEAEKNEREAQEKFNQRMSSFDEEHDLSEEHRGVIANEIKELDDESFVAYKEKMKVFLPEKVEKEAETAATTEEVAASEEEPKAEKEEVVEEAIDNAEVEEDAVAATTEAEDANVYEKYKNAFSIDNFDIR